jgi:hypothetical protein
MSNCLLSSGWAIGCNKLRSGIRNVYIIKSSLVQYVQINEYDIVTFINTGTSSYYDLEIKRNTGEFNEKLIIDEKTGGQYWDQTVVVPLIKSSYLLRTLVIQLINDKYSIIVKDQTGKYWLIGKEFFCRVKDAEGTRGKIHTDFNGTKITFLSKEDVPAYEVDPSAFTISSDRTTGVTGNQDELHQ